MGAHGRSRLRILVINGGSILVLGVIQMIEKRSNLDLVETQLAENGLIPPERKLQEIDQVIFDTGQNIKAQACLTWLFEYFPNVPFIVINSQDGWMRLCNQREILIREPEDLVEAIRISRDMVGAGLVIHPQPRSPKK